MPKNLHFALCPATFLDLTVCDFFLWGNVKDTCYTPPLPANIDDMKDQITAPIITVNRDNVRRVWDKLSYRLDVVRDSNYGINNMFLRLPIVGQKFQITVLPPNSLENFCCIKKSFNTCFKRPILNIWVQFPAQSPFHNLFISGSVAHIIIKSENKAKAINKKQITPKKRQYSKLS